jgi:alpha-galactosidase
MRADYNQLAVTQLQSTTDQQDFRLYPPVAASAPATIVPEQCGNWAYPAVEMSAEEVQFTLVTGLSGRFYLSGFLHDLKTANRALIVKAVALHKAWRPWLSRSEPFWPLGFPAWDDEAVCLGLTDGTTTRVFVWDRAENGREIVLPGAARGSKATIVPLARTEEQWTVRAEGGDLVVNTVPGFTARVIEVR